MAPGVAARRPGRATAVRSLRRFARLDLEDIERAGRTSVPRDVFEKLLKHGSDRLGLDLRCIFEVELEHDTALAGVLAVQLAVGAGSNDT